MYIESVSNGRSRPVTLLRESYREGKKVLKRTIANLSRLDPVTIDLLKRRLKGENFISVEDAFTNIGAKSHGHVAAVLSAIKKLGVASLIESRPCRERDLVVAMIASRILFARSKLATVSNWSNTTLPEELGIEGATEEDLYTAMDWLYERKERIEGKLVARHLKPGDAVLYDVSSSYVEGSHCPLAQFGYNRDKKRGKKQINYGLMTDMKGRPLIIDAFPGNTTDSATVLPMVSKIRETYGLKEFVFVGDRGMLTKPNIKILRSLDGVDWVSALRSTSIKQLVEQDKFQMGLFDERNLFELVLESDYPGERLIACRNDSLKSKRAANRESLLVKTEKELETVVKRVRSGSLADEGDIGIAVGRVIDKFRMKKHFVLKIENAYFTFERNEKSIQEESMLDGIYIIRTSLGKDELDAPSCVRSYKNLSEIEKAFLSMKSMDLRIRPIYHYREERVRTHFFLCMLSYYVEWHMRKAWEELTFTDEEKDFREDPVSTATRSASAKKKDSTKHNKDGLRVRDFSGVISALAALPMNTYRVGTGEQAAQFRAPAQMTPLQERAMNLVQVMNCAQ